ncbi:unnamed protein product, partial [Prorocentrum cordatum]
MAPSPAARRNQQRSKWRCRCCAGRDGKPFVNYPDKLACHNCSVSNSAAFLSTPSPKQPSTSPSSRTESQQPGAMAIQLPAVEKRVAGLTAEVKQATAQHLAKDADAMEVEVVSDSRKRTAELDGLIKTLSAIRPATPEIEQPPATGDAAEDRWGLSKMAQVLEQMGLATGLQEKAQGVAQEIK